MEAGITEVAHGSNGVSLGTNDNRPWAIFSINIQAFACVALAASFKASQKFNVTVGDF